MNQRIIYQEAGKPVSILIPCECGLSVQQIGLKDVPNGVPFWIVTTADIPSDRSLRDAWEIDTEALGNPVGHGSKGSEV